MEKEIRIPQGMVDLLPQQSAKKKFLEEKVEKIFIRDGYERIDTPAIEFFETFRNAYQDVRSEEMYRFFDSDGRLLVLKEDMTVPIARICASKLYGTNGVFRIRYCSDVFKVRNTFAGKRNEVTDCGIELIGADESSDLEVLVTALDVMESLGLKNWRFEIGNSCFFKTACLACCLAEDEARKLADLTDHKSMVDLEEYLQTLSIDRQQKDFFLNLPMMAGGEEILEKTREICFSDALRKEIDKTSLLNEKLKQLGYGARLCFDLGRIPHLDYYTGILFAGYAEDVATSFLSGGRYDSLLQKFGRDLPACGFSVKLDYLLDSIEDVPLEKPWKLCYPKGKETEALVYARELRKQHSTVLCCSNQEKMEVVK